MQIKKKMINTLIPSKLQQNSSAIALLCSRSVVPDSLQPQGLQPTSLLCPWESPGKNTGVGCHLLLQGVFLTQGSNPSLLSPVLAGSFFTSEPPGKPRQSQMSSRRNTKHQNTVCLNSRPLSGMLVRFGNH